MLDELRTVAKQAGAIDVEKEIALESSFASLLEAMLKLWGSAQDKEKARSSWAFYWTKAKSGESKEAELQGMREALVKGIVNGILFDAGGIFKSDAKEDGESSKVGALRKRIAAAAEQAKNLGMLDLFSEHVGQRVEQLEETPGEIAESSQHFCLKLLQAKMLRRLRQCLAVKQAVNGDEKAEFMKAKLDEQKRTNEEAKAELEAQKKVNALLKRLREAAGQGQSTKKLLQEAERYQKEFAETKQDLEAKSRNVQAKFYEELIQRQADGVEVANLDGDLAKFEAQLGKMDRRDPARAETVDAMAALKEKIVLEGLKEEWQQLNEGKAGVPEDYPWSANLAEQILFMQQRIYHYEGNQGWTKNFLLTPEYFKSN